MTEDATPPAARRSRRSLVVRSLAAVVAVTLVIGGAIYTHGYQPGYHGVGLAFTIKEPLGPEPNAANVDIPVRLDVGRFGRVLAVRPDWPRTPDGRRCFIPGGLDLETSYLIDGKLGFEAAITFVHHQSGQWTARASWGKDFKKDVPVSVVEEGWDVRWGPRKHASVDCKEFHIRLPAGAVVVGSLSGGSGGGSSAPYDSPEWKAHFAAAEAKRLSGKRYCDVYRC